MRQLSTAALDEIFSEVTTASYFHLLTFKAKDNEGNDTSFHFVDNEEAVVSNGVTYQPAVFKIQLGKDIRDEIPRVQLSFDAGDRQLVRKLREFDSQPEIEISIISSNRPNDPEISDIEYIVDSWVIADTVITMTLTIEPVLSEPICGDIVSPTLFPLLWENISISGNPSELDTLPGGGGVDGGGSGGGSAPVNPDSPPPFIQP